MSWSTFHVDEAVTFDDSVCNFGRVFYHDTIHDKVHIMTRIKKNNSINTWTIIVRDAKDVRRAITSASTWNIHHVFNIINPPPSPPPSIAGETIDRESLPSTSISIEHDTLLSKFMNLLRFT